LHKVEENLLLNQRLHQLLRHLQLMLSQLQLHLLRLPMLLPQPLLSIKDLNLLQSVQIPHCLLAQLQSL
jgi:hypothetical protein